MDNAQLLMAALIVLIICLVVWFTSWNNYNNTKPVKNPADASDDQDNQAYYDANYGRTANIAKVVGLIAAVFAGYLYYNMGSYEASCIWGGFSGGVKDDDDWGLIDNNLGTPAPS